MARSLISSLGCRVARIAVVLLAAHAGLAVAPAPSAEAKPAHLIVAKKKKAHRKPTVRRVAMRKVAPAAPSLVAVPASPPPHLSPPANPSATTPAQPEADVAGPPSGSELAAILRNVPGKVVAAGLVVELASGAVVMDLDARKVVYPASVEKLFPTAAILRSQPHDKRLETSVRGKVGADGSVPVLAVVGGGDPTMGAGDWGKLAEAVVARGVRRVSKLVVDATLFDDKLPRGFDEKATDAAYRAPIGAINCDAATLQVQVRPGAVGAPPVVETWPDAGDAVAVRNEAATVKKGKNTLTIVTRPLGRQTEIVVTGQMPASARVIGTGKRRVADATVFAAAVFKAQLARRGVTFQGPSTYGPATGDLPVIAQHFSPTLLEVAKVTNKTSHNGYAETLYKLTAALQGQVPASSEKAQAAVAHALQGLEVRWPGTVVANGSGLYHASKVTCETVVDLLRAMAHDPAGPAWRSTLAVGGQDGTLRGRLHPVRGRVQAKTGTLDDVVGLAGYADALDGRSYAFAFFYNDVRQGAGAYRAAQDRVLRRVIGVQ